MAHRLRSLSGGCESGHGISVCKVPGCERVPIALGQMVGWKLASSGMEPNSLDAMSQITYLLTVVGHWSRKGQLPHCALPLVHIAICWSMVKWSCGGRVRGVSRPRGCGGHRSIALPAPCLLCPRPTHKQTNKYKFSTSGPSQKSLCFKA